MQDVVAFNRTSFDLPDGFQGTTHWVQLVNDDSWELQGGTWKHLKKPDGYGLDKDNPYSNEINTRDIPSQILDSTIHAEAARHFQAMMYLMFTPAGVGGHAVPLQVASYDWSGTAVLQGGQWVAGATMDPAAVKTIKSTNTTSFPEWDYNSDDIIKNETWE